MSDPIPTMPITEIKLTPKEWGEIMANLDRLYKQADHLELLEARARDVIKWKGSRNTPRRRAIERLEAVLREGE